MSSNKRRSLQSKKLKKDESRSRSRSPHRRFQSNKMDSINVSNNLPSMNDMTSSKFTRENIRSQSFAIPEKIIYYIAKKPSSSKLWQKLIQACKYFYGTNHIIVVDALCCDNYDDIELDNYQHESDPEDEMNETDSEKEGDTEISPEKKVCWKATLKNNKKVDINSNFLIKNKLWIDGILYQADYESLPASEISSLITKIYRCDLSRLIIHDQKITFDEFLFLTSNKNLSHFSANNLEIVYNSTNDEIVPFEVIAAHLLKASTISWNVENPRLQKCFTSETAKVMTKLPIFENLHFLQLIGLPQCFDFDSFWNFAMAQPYLRKKKSLPPSDESKSPVLFIRMADDVPQNHSQKIENFLIHSVRALPEETRPSIHFGRFYIYAESDSEENE